MACCQNIQAMSLANSGNRSNCETVVEGKLILTETVLVLNPVLIQRYSKTFRELSQASTQALNPYGQSKNKNVLND